MENKIIRGAALLHYEKNVEGEPLDQDTPIECFHAGAEFVINAQKNRNNRNIPKDISYNNQKKSMDTYKKILENIEKIDTVTGFHVTAPGDESVGIPSASWEIRNDFHFDSKEDLENFRREIQELFEYYCGEVTSVFTFEEHEAQCEKEDEDYYEQFPVRYLIKDGSVFKKANTTAVYGSSAAEGIHTELPHYMSLDGYNGHDTVIIKSTDPEFRKILLEEAGQLEHRIKNDEYSLRNNKMRLRLIQQELKHGK